MTKLRKTVISIFLIFAVMQVFLFSEEPENTETEKKSFLDTVSLSVKLPTTVYLNLGDKKDSAPSPILFTPGIGFIWPNESFLAFEPSANFFYNYYLWHDGKALPAEIENRTATTLSVLLDLPVVFTLNIAKSRFKVNAGAAFLMRFGWQSEGTDPSASEELKLINDYFWGKGRFLYLSGAVSWMIPTTNNTKFGPFMTIYAPVGSIFAREGLNGMIISVGLKIFI